jgi:hypothetical protein
VKPGPLLIWSGREIGRHPDKAAALFLALAALTVLAATVLTLHRSVAMSVDRLMDQAPSIVVRRVGSGGWMPMPVEQGLSAAGAVAGVLRPRVRIWGVVEAAGQPVTVVAITHDQAEGLPDGYRSPAPGEALIGGGVIHGRTGGSLLLSGREAVELSVRDRLPAAADMAVHDLVLLHPDDARRLLGLRPDQASDLVLDVFHPEEAGPLADALTGAFPWPVQAVTREAVKKYYAGRIAGRAGVGLLSLAPALLALVFLVLALGMWSASLRPEMGLMKSMGWTSSDLLFLHLARAVILGGPAVAAGLMGGVAILFLPAGRWLARLLFGWPGPAPDLPVPAMASPLVLAAVLVLAPYLVASFWTGWRAVQADPIELIEGGAV